MTDTKNSLNYYTPTFFDAIKIYWSMFWRSCVIGLIVLVPIFIVITMIMTMKGQSEAQLVGYVEQMKSGSLPLQFVIAQFILHIVIGYFAFRDLVKATYKNFVFDRTQVTPRSLLTLILSLTLFSSIFSYFAAPAENNPSSLSLMLYVTINFIVSFAIIQHFLSSGFLGSRLYLLPREES